MYAPMMQALHHVGYWVDDLDAAMKQWHRDLGVGPFDVIAGMHGRLCALRTPGDRSPEDGAA